MSRMAPPAPPGPGAPSPQQMADQAAELIRTVTQGALSTPEQLLERAQRAGLAVAPLLVEPPYSRETYRGRRITLDGWLLVGQVCSAVYGQPVVALIRSVEAWTDLEGLEGPMVTAEAQTADGRVLGRGVGWAPAYLGGYTDADQARALASASVGALCQALQLAVGWVLLLSPVASLAPDPLEEWNDPEATPSAPSAPYQPPTPRPRPANPEGPAEGPEWEAPPTMPHLDPELGEDEP